MGLTKKESINRPSIQLDSQPSITQLQSINQANDQLIKLSIKQPSISLQLPSIRTTKNKTRNASNNKVNNATQQSNGQSGHVFRVSYDTPRLVREVLLDRSCQLFDSNKHSVCTIDWTTRAIDQSTDRPVKQSSEKWKGTSIVSTSKSLRNQAPPVTQLLNQTMNNHIFGTKCITDKGCLARSMRRMQTIYQSSNQANLRTDIQSRKQSNKQSASQTQSQLIKQSIFDFVPQSWLIPREVDSLIEHWTSVNTLINQTNTQSDNPTNNHGSNNQSNKQASNQIRSPPMFIFKPAASSQGRSIQVLTSIDQLDSINQINHQTSISCSSSVKSAPARSSVQSTVPPNSQANTQSNNRTPQCLLRRASVGSVDQSTKQTISLPSINQKGNQTTSQSTNQPIKPTIKGESIIQEYLSPYLLSGHKFDFRLYVLVTNVRPLTAFLFSDGLVRFCSKPYQSIDQTNKQSNDFSRCEPDVFSHLTNFSINKHNHQSNDESINQTIGPDYKWSLSKFLRHQSDNQSNDQWNESKFLADLHTVCALTLIPLISIDHSTKPSSRQSNDRSNDDSFELFGFDVMLDEHQKLYLIEVNRSPSLSYQSNDHSIKQSMLHGMFDILGIGNPVGHSINQSINSFSNRSMDQEEFKEHEIFLDQSNNQSNGQWRPLFPFNQKTSELNQTIKQSIKQSNNQSIPALIAQYSKSCVKEITSEHKRMIKKSRQ